mgnify:CR=1 FL=1
MSDFFNKFSRVDYIFGDDYFVKGGGDFALELIQNLTSYVEVVDSIKQNSSFYSKYQILEGDRPDQVSQKLYGTPNYHWTFYIMNDNIRASGWPLTNLCSGKKVCLMCSTPGIKIFLNSFELFGIPPTVNAPMFIP